MYFQFFETALINGKLPNETINNKKTSLIKTENVSKLCEFVKYIVYKRYWQYMIKNNALISEKYKT